MQCNVPCILKRITMKFREYFDIMESCYRRNIYLKHVGTKTIETTRLTLRRLELTDAEMMFSNWTGDYKVTRFLRWDAHKTIDDTKNMIQQWVNKYQYDSTYYWGIYLKDGEMIGSIGITITSEYDFKGELGYKIGKPLVESRLFK